MKRTFTVKPKTVVCAATVVDPTENPTFIEDYVYQVYDNYKADPMTKRELIDTVTRYMQWAVEAHNEDRLDDEDIWEINRIDQDRILRELRKYDWIGPHDTELRL